MGPVGGGGGLGGGRRGGRRAGGACIFQLGPPVRLAGGRFEFSSGTSCVVSAAVAANVWERGIWYRLYGHYRRIIFEGADT